MVGAGPGNPELITLKGLEKIKECDCIVYDRLSGDELLSYTNDTCEQIYVGKKPGHHYRKQEEINRILVEASKRHEVVVRLKGGDPFVFGRGGEEIEVLMAEGIEYEVIPGISSAIAVPECVGVPVTHRSMARSFHVVTGHTKEGGIDREQVKKLAGQEGTLVFLMGLASLEEIADALIEGGRIKNTPVAVISDGTTIYERQVRGTLCDIADKVKKENISSPAVIVVGETASKYYRYDRKNPEDKDDTSFLEKNASKIRVGVTATPALYQRLKDTFLRAGIRTALVCDMDVEKLDAGMDRLSAILRGEEEGLDSYSWVVFTSQNGVRLFFEQLRREKKDLRMLFGLKFAVLGSGTRDTLMQYGFQADLVPSRYTVECLCEELKSRLTNSDRVLIPRAKQGSDELTDGWPASSSVLSIYDVRGRATRHMKRLDELTHLIFASASGVEAFFEELKRNGQELPDVIKTVCIGDITAKRLARYGRYADSIASIQDVEGLLNAVGGTSI